MKTNPFVDPVSIWPASRIWSAMMKPQTLLALFLIVAFFLGGCGQSSSTALPGAMNQHPSSTLNSPTATLTHTPQPSQTATSTATIEPSPIPTITPITTPTSLPTLEPDIAGEKIRTLLQDAVDCAAPCFWGIVPGDTNLGESEKVFTHLGLPIMSGYNEGKDFSGINYDLAGGLSLGVSLTIQDHVVENIRVIIIPEKPKAGKVREWLAYSPEALIKRYGMPSRVDFHADWGPGPLFGMVMYFEKVDLIVQYTGEKIIPIQRGASWVCPLTAQFDDVRLWIGKDPLYPPGRGTPLEKVTSFTIETFAKLMGGDPNQACFIFNGNAMP